MKQSPYDTKNKLDKVGCGFCLAKWTQVTIHLGSGINHSCHHVKAHTIPIDELEKNPNVLHNTGFKKNVRKQMLSGERPGECDYCWRIEDNTEKFSDRVWKSADSWSWPDYDTISKFTGDEDVYPRYVEISFSNVCNFKCGYCGPAFSSKWSEEITQHGPYTFTNSPRKFNIIDEYQKQIPKKDYNPYIDAFWKWFPEAIKHMHTFRITGGEPLLSKDTFKVIDHLLENPQPNLEFCINSNACPPGDKWKEFTNKVYQLQKNNCIKKFTLFVSAEATGEQQEYNRFGMDWKMFDQNVNFFLENTSANVSIMAAFNFLSLPTFKDFIQYVSNLKNQFQDRVHLDTPYVRNPSFLDAKIATEDLVKRYLVPCLSFMKHNNFTVKEIENFERILQDLNKRFLNKEEFSQTTSTDRRMFYEYIKEYDKRRGTEFKKTFPQLIKFYEECSRV